MMKVFRLFNMNLERGMSHNAQTGAKPTKFNLTTAHTESYSRFAEFKRDYIPGRRLQKEDMLWRIEYFRGREPLSVYFLWKTP